VSGAIRDADAAINRRNGRGSSTNVGKPRGKKLAADATKKAVCALDDGPANGVTAISIMGLEIQRGTEREKL
jgi:hypothetical protein